MQGWAWAWPGPSAQNILAWVYKSSADLQDKRPQSRQAPNIEFSVRMKCDRKKRAQAWVAGRSRAGPGPARASYLNGSTGLALVYKSSVGL